MGSRLGSVSGVGDPSFVLGPGKSGTRDKFCNKVQG